VKVKVSKVLAILLVMLLIVPQMAFAADTYYLKVEVSGPDASSVNKTYTAYTSTYSDLDTPLTAELVTFATSNRANLASDSFFAGTGLASQYDAAIAAYGTAGWEAYVDGTGATASPAMFIDLVKDSASTLGDLTVGAANTVTWGSYTVTVTLVKNAVTSGGGGGSSSGSDNQQTTPSTNTDEVLDTIQVSDAAVAAGEEQGAGSVVEVATKADADEYDSVLKVTYPDGTTEILTYGAVIGDDAVAILEKGGTIEVVKVDDVYGDTQGHWAKPYLNFVGARGLYDDIAQGDHVNPDRTLNRGLIATVIYRLEGGKAQGSTNPFDDVTSRDIYNEAITWAYENGIVNGYSSDEYGDTDPVTREQYAAIMYRYAQRFGYTLDGTVQASFADQSSVSDYAVEAVNWAVSKGLLEGDENNMLNPQGTLTNGEAAAVITRFILNVLG